MRRLVPFAAALVVAGCATKPAPQPEAPAPAPEKPQVRSDLTGLTTGELIQRFGQPALQVREGPGLKLQFRGTRCVLDAYLYPTPQGGLPEKVTHVDTRLTSGADTSQQDCIASLSRS